MELNNKLITNRSSFVENFSMKEAFEKIHAICDFFEETICILSDDEKFLIDSLKRPEKVALFNEYEFIYAKAKANEWKKIYDELSEEDKTKIKQALILLELAENDGKSIATEMLVLNVEKSVERYIEDIKDLNTLKENESFTEFNNDVIDVTEHIGSIKLKKYNFNETVSEKNKIIAKTFINKSTNPYNIITIEVFDDISKQTYCIKLGSEEAIIGTFIQNKLVALFPSVSLGEKHIVVRSRSGKYKNLSADKNEIFEYNLSGNDIRYFSATNDGAVFLVDDNIKLFSDDQITFEYSQKIDEKLIMVCVRENRYVVLTDYGRLYTNTGESMENICYVVMRETGDWYAISAEGIKYCNGKKIYGNIQADTNFESITLSLENNTELEEKILSYFDCCDIDKENILDDAVFYGEAYDYIVVETTKERILCNNNLKVIRYDK